MTGKYDDALGRRCKWDWNSFTLRLAIPRRALECREFAQETCSNQRWRRWITLASRWETCRLHQGQDMPSSTAGDRRSATCHRRCYVIRQGGSDTGLCDLSTAVRVLLCNRFTDLVSSQLARFPTVRWREMPTVGLPPPDISSPFVIFSLAYARQKLEANTTWPLL